MVNGMCGSGRTADCNGYHTEINCCPIANSKNCEWKADSYGQTVSCPSNAAARGICGSGRNADCRVTGSKSYFGVDCCELTDLELTGLPYVKYSSYGERISCRDGDVMVAGCGSGSLPDCAPSHIEGFTGNEVAEIHARMAGIPKVYNAMKCFSLGQPTATTGSFLTDPFTKQNF